MNCDQTQPLLEAFADGELGWGTARRIRRHLAGCPACTAELAEVRHLTARVHTWRDVPAPAGLGSRLAAALPSLSPAAALPPRRVRLTRRAAVGLAGIAAAAAAFFWLLPGQPGRPTIAFADVEQAMQQVNTLSWVTTSYYLDQRGNKIESSLLPVYTWVRRRPAAITNFEQPKGWRDLIDKRGELRRTTEGYYQKHELGKYTETDIAKKAEGLIRKMTQPPTTKDGVLKSSGNTIIGYTGKPLHAISSSFHILTMPVQEHQAELDGRMQTLFTRDSEMTIAAYAAYPTPILHIRQSMWADPATHRITQVEIQNSGGVLGPNRKGVIIYSHFRYNETPPPGVFDWSPPPGAKVQNMGPLNLGSHARAKE